MPVLLLLTILTAPAVPQSSLPLLVGARATASAETVRECRLRVGPGGVPIVRVDVGSGVQAWFVLDTGASGTTVHPALASRLGLSLNGTTRITTAHGTMTTSTARLSSLGVGGLELARDLDVAVHDLTLVRQVVPDFEVDLPPGGDSTHMDPTRTEAELGFKPEYGVEHGIADYIDWLKTHPN